MIASIIPGHRYVLDQNLQVQMAVLVFSYSPSAHPIVLDLVLVLDL
ncbi:MAG: hypothetical protein JO151_15670 [Verrucomicrobia bacterium]|nr:hypothetical protein [Verrucomicrobiota bacterium]